METPASTNEAYNLLQALKQPRTLSCVQCQKRKVKCDRHSPCSNCIKVRPCTSMTSVIQLLNADETVQAEIPCTAGTSAPARKRRATKEDLLDRVTRCEALLKEYAPVGHGPDQKLTASKHDPDDPPGASFEPSSSAQELNTSYITTRDDGNVRFTDSFGTAMLHEEVNTDLSHISCT